MAGGGAAFAQLVQTDFEVDPTSIGWGSNGPLNSWTTEQSASPSHSLKLAGNLWISPTLPMQEHQFYQLNFKSLISGPGTYGIYQNGATPYKVSGGWTNNEFAFRGEPGVANTAVFFTTPSSAPGYIDDVTITEITRAQAAESLDRYYAEMNQFDFTAPGDRHQHIPQTIQALQNGDDLRVVMLGDSIVADTSGGYFEPLVDRMYPDSQTNIITSVRGSTGAWWYEQENRVQEYVLDHNPDLVMIGGISHHDPSLPANDVQSDIESIRNVIDQIRAGNSDIEIILMSEAAGGNQSATALGDVDPNGTSYRSLLYQLAEEENVEFVDMTAPWTNYILDSGLPYSAYMRDAIHMNHMGMHITARTLEAYFAPVPEPASITATAIALGALALRRRR